MFQPAKAIIQEVRNISYYILPDFIAYPGHGPHTTIEQEKNSNPFVRG
jgi:hydroxyacylglutathione hydrolase